MPAKSGYHYCIYNGDFRVRVGLLHCGLSLFIEQVASLPIVIQIIIITCRADVTEVSKELKPDSGDMSLYLLSNFTLHNHWYCMFNTNGLNIMFWPDVDKVLVFSSVLQSPKLRQVVAP
jgi:hypothetical protein